MTTLGEAIDEFRKYGPSGLSQQEIADALRLKLETVLAADTSSKTDTDANFLRSLDVSMFQVQAQKTDMDPALVAYVDDKFRQLQAVLTQRVNIAVSLVNDELGRVSAALNALKERVDAVELAIPKPRKSPEVFVPSSILKTPENVQSMAACLLAAVFGVTFEDAAHMIRRMGHSPPSWYEVAETAIDHLDYLAKNRGT